MDYIKAFLVGGLFCLLGQIVIDKTKLTPARILVAYVVIGVILGAIGFYEPIVEFAHKHDVVWILGVECIMNTLVIFFVQFCKTFC